MPKTKFTEEELKERKRKQMIAGNKKYMQKVRQVMVKFNLETEEVELFKHIEGRKSMQGYVKELIRRDMEGKVDWN